MARYTIKDIARIAGVSPTAVSFVVNDKPGVGRETRERIQKILDETGFAPQLSSKRLVHQRTYNIALLTQPSSSPFDDLFYSEVMKGLVRETQRLRYNLVFCPLNHDANGDFEVPGILLHHDCDGVIVLQDIEKGFLGKLKSYGNPVVIVDNSEITTDVPYARVDNEKLMYLATDHVIQRGHRRIGLIGQGSLPAFYSVSFSGFKRAISDSGLLIDPTWILDTATDIESAYEAMRRTLESGKSLPTVFVCMSDRLAIGAMNAAKDGGLKIPTDLSFIGIDDIVLSRYVEPPLTTIAIDKLALGTSAARMLIDCIDGHNAESVTLEMNRVIDRASVAQLGLTHEHRGT